MRLRWQLNTELEESRELSKQITQGKSIQASEHSKCKGPEVDMAELQQGRKRQGRNENMSYWRFLGELWLLL